MKCPPLKIIYSSDGSATSEIVTQILQIRENVKNHPRIKAFGISFDGDPKFKSLHFDFIKDWHQKLESSTSFRDFITQVSPSSFIFGDSPHLLKRGRLF